MKKLLVLLSILLLTIFSGCYSRVVTQSEYGTYVLKLKHPYYHTYHYKYYYPYNVYYPFYTPLPKPYKNYTIPKKNRTNETNIIRNNDGGRDSKNNQNNERRRR